MRSLPRLVLALCALSGGFCSNPPATGRDGPAAVTPRGAAPVSPPERSHERAQGDASAGGVFVAELDPALELQSFGQAGLLLLEAFASRDKTYAIFEAPSMDALARYLDRTGVPTKKITPVRDINSPVRGGGHAAGQQPRSGHKTFVIERQIPGVGGFPEERKQAISRRANAAVQELGDAIEWDYSYLTDEGTYCVYRATGEDKVRQHAAIASAPINKVSEVRKLVASHD